MMKSYDIVIIGGGLSGSLLLAGILHQSPRLNILLIEKSNVLGGNHTWCFHEHDIPATTRPWLAPLISKTWSRHEVLFPKHQRMIDSPYHCIKSHDLHNKITSQYSKNILFNTEVLSWTAAKNGHGQVLHYRTQGQPETHLHAHSFVDARGWIHTFQSNKVAWQKFVGLEVKLKKPHGLTHAILKDARVPQIDGYRFIYTLPFSETELLIEDTYYSNHSILKTERIELEIEKYAKEKGWEIEEVLRKEVGCLPLTLYSDKNLQPTKTSIGAASLFFNPVTGYTFPQTIRSIEALLERSAFSQESIEKVLANVRSKSAQQEKYFKLLNRMMFLSAEPTQRYVILERFYQLNLDLIHRFYSGQLTLMDQIRILVGKPPVPVQKALRVLQDRNKD